MGENHKGLAAGILSMPVASSVPAIGAPVAAWLIVTYSWKWMFLLTGVLGLMWLVPWLSLFVRNDQPVQGTNWWCPRSLCLPACRSASDPEKPGDLGRHDQQLLLRLFHLLLHDLDAGLPGRTARVVAGQVGALHLLQLCRHRHRGHGWEAGWRIASSSVAVQRRVRSQGLCHRRLHRRQHRACWAPIAETRWTAALFWNVLSLTLLGLATANNLALCKLTLIPKQGHRPRHRCAAAGHEPGGRGVGKPLWLAPACQRQL